MATDSLARPLFTIGCLLFVHSMNFWLVSFFFVFNLCSLFFQVKLSSQNIIDQKCILSLFLCFYCLWCIIIFFDFFLSHKKKLHFSETVEWIWRTIWFVPEWKLSDGNQIRHIESICRLLSAINVNFYHLDCTYHKKNKIITNRIQTQIIKLDA